MYPTIFLTVSRRLFLLLACCTALAAQSKPASAAESAADTVRRVRKTVQNIKSISCTFRQERYIKSMDRVSAFEGTIRMKKPDRLRVEYPAQTIVVDGETVWWYISKNNQVTVQPYEKGEDAFPTPYGIFRKYVPDDRAAANVVPAGEETVNGRPCIVLELAAENGTIVTVWIDRKLDIPVKTVEESSEGDRTTYILGDVVLNSRIGDEVFRFEVPDGVSVVDMR